uniref:Uncharacterized protein n=1 Tax=viral metagenome TaxID=1070528 RepID=A0A6C0JZM6_9ZZZZ
MAMLQAITDHMRLPEPKRWITKPLSEAHLATLERECEAPSDFDEIFSKKHLWALFKAGRIHPVVKQHPNGLGTVVALLPDPKQVDEIPWDLWSIILQMFKRKDGLPYSIFLCAHPARREFPAFGQPVTPLHINGGYTYPCDATCVFVFRAQEATRVLIHELFHSSCCDNTNLPLEEREAETEAWAELIWCALMARGDLKTFKSYVKKQASWIMTQNAALLQGRHMQPGHQGFPWRYTVGKALWWQRWGLLEKALPTAPLQGSLRLTFMPPGDLKRSWNVPTSSMML